MAVPFTTPGLAGARVRVGKAGLELVFANPSGARGTYVVPWAGVPDVCTPTLHDLRLLAALKEGAGNIPAERAATVGPKEVQAAARRVALSGAAGRAARAAAAAAAADERRVLAAARHLAAAVAASGVAGLDAEAVEALARTVAGLGIGPDADAAPVPRAVAALAGLQGGLTAWAAVRHGDAPLARLAAALAQWAAARAAEAMAVARHPSDTALLQAWSRNPDEVATLAARPAWLLDGWGLPCLAWADAAPGSTAALLEVAALAPPFPREAEAWTGRSGDPAAAGLLRRMLAVRSGGARDAARRGMAAAGADARSANAADLVARNEHWRALAA